MIDMTALVLERAGELSLRDFHLKESLGPDDVRIAMRNVGICGSDIHYFKHGSIGPFVVREPMILGHEASGVVIEKGDRVRHLSIGDRVCMEPGVPNPTNRATREGRYNLDPGVRFWATPPIHGCLRPTVIHPAEYTFKLPDNVSFAEGAMIEPLAVGVHAAAKARITPGAVAVVMGAGPIGLLTVMSALAAGCSHVIVADVQRAKLSLAGKMRNVTPVYTPEENLKSVVSQMTDQWGADVLFECSGSPKAAAGMFDLLCPGGCAVLIGMPGEPLPLDVVAAQVKEIRMETVFRYAHVFPRALQLISAGTIDVKPLITDTFPFNASVEAFHHAASMPANSVKVQIQLSDE